MGSTNIIFILFRVFCFSSIYVSIYAQAGPFLTFTFCSNSLQRIEIAFVRFREDHLVLHLEVASMKALRFHAD